MALYQYVAVDKTGKKLSGILDAESLLMAKDRLRKKEIIVTKIAEAKNQKDTHISTSLRISFTRDVSQLLQAKLPLFESLVTIEEKYRNHKKHFIFLDLCDQVRKGKKLSQALSAYPNAFDPVYCSMVEAGENTGELETAFLQLFRVISRSDKCKRQARAALIYPMFLLSFCLMILCGLFFFLIPSMTELFEGRALHPMTMGVLQLSVWLQASWHLILGGITLLSVGGTLYFRSEKGRNAWKRLCIRLPLVGSIMLESILTRFCRVFSILLSSGVPIVDALGFARGVVHHIEFEELLLRVEEGVVRGRKLSEELKNSSLIPPLVIRMIETSEEAGNTDEMFMNISEIYEEKLEKTISSFTNLLQPVMLLVLGVIVGVVLLSVLLPLTDMSTLI